MFLRVFSHSFKGCPEGPSIYHFANDINMLPIPNSWTPATSSYQGVISHRENTPQRNVKICMLLYKKSLRPKAAMDSQRPKPAGPFPEARTMSFYP